MHSLIFTVDLDWACEPAIEETINFLHENNIKPTIFITHSSSIVEKNIDKIDIGLHPYFGSDSSHGSTIQDVVKHVMNLPHNLAAFRCHRFASCNASHQAMADAGMLISSNVCTDLEIISPFKNRFGLLEVPIFLEDGGYLWCKHPLEMTQKLRNAVLRPGRKVIIIHPMHFSLNTPHFNYMYDIKNSVNRSEWKNMSRETLDKYRWKGRGIRDLLVDLVQIEHKSSSLRTLITSC